MKRHGFTLAELVIAISLLGIVGVSFAYLYTAAQRYMIQSVNFTATQTEASFALEHMKRYLTLASAIVQPPEGNPPANQSAQLEFTWRQTIAGADQTSRYELQGNELRFIPNVAQAGAFETVARSVEQVQFTRVSPGMVRLDVTSSQNSGGDARQTRLQTIVSPRGLF